LTLWPNENVMKKPRPTLTSINRKLAKAAELLDAASGDIRDVGLRPRENIRKIASALMEVFEVQHQIYRREPEPPRTRRDNSDCISRLPSAIT
jgi:hypothetical protein